jgi:hypothetical protein
MDEIHPFKIAWMYEFHSSLMDRCHLSIHGAHEPINHKYVHPSIQYIHIIIHLVYLICFQIDECHPMHGQ